MRWTSLTADTDSSQGALFGLDEIVTRTIDTPEFRGMTFYEVRARSLVNRVPAASRVPFRWTINPYRGCSHACRYCLAPDTPVTMADGTRRPIGDLRVGDRVVGTRRDRGGSRQYVTTDVLAHWSTIKRGHRVRLEDGTELVASGDHRFLTARGWAWVNPEAGTRRRAMRVGDTVLGPGRGGDLTSVASPEFDPEHRRGYLCGHARGQAGRRAATVAAPVRLDVVRRVRAHLDALARDGFALAAGAESWGGGAVDARWVRSGAVIADPGVWGHRPARPAQSWRIGFLAGVADACARPIEDGLQFDLADPETVESTVSSLRELGFRCALRGGGRRREPLVVTLAGGLVERQRFVTVVNPARLDLAELVGERVGSAAIVESIEDLALDMPMVDITTGTGDFLANGVVSHNCFARKTHEYLDLDAGDDFDRRIVVKVNAPELLRAELRAPRWRGEHIAMGTNVDCYQRAEGRYRLMPPILGALRDARNPFSILTKGSLLLRDLDLLREAAAVTDVTVNISVGTVDEALAAAVEPGTPSPRARLRTCRALSDAGIGCGVLMAPVLPYLSDSPQALRRTVAAVAEAGARTITPLVLHLRPGAREWYLSWLATAAPELVARYAELYRGGAYAPNAYQRGIAERVRELARQHGLGVASAPAARHGVARTATAGSPG